MQSMTEGEDTTTATRDSAQAQIWTLSETRTFVYALPAVPAPGTQSPKAPRLQKLCFQHCGQVQAGQWNCIFERRVDAAQTVTDAAYVWGLDLSGSMQGPHSTGSGPSAGGGDGLSKGAQRATEGSSESEGRTAISGNVTALVDAADGSVVARYDYSPFGMTVLADGPAAAANSWRFSTKYHDPETSLVYYGYRYYSPELGRWINRDPIGERGGLNGSCFAGNRPTGLVDPEGLASWYFPPAVANYVCGKTWNRTKHYNVANFNLWVYRVKVNCVCNYALSWGREQKEGCRNRLFEPLTTSSEPIEKKFWPSQPFWEQYVKVFAETHNSAVSLSLTYKASAYYSNLFDFGVKYSVDAAGSAEKLVWVPPCCKCAHVGAQCTCTGAFTQNPGGPTAVAASLATVYGLSVVSSSYLVPNFVRLGGQILQTLVASL
jgi:RHS repeat-associated protein